MHPIFEISRGEFNREETNVMGLYSVVKVAWSYNFQAFLTDPPAWQTDRRTDGRTDRRTGDSVYSAL